MAGLINPRDLDRQVDIQGKVADGAPDGAGSETWEPVETGVWAQVQDMLPSRGDRLAEGINVQTRPARVRMRYRDDIVPGMRLVMGTRIMRIVTAPAEIGRREGIEIMVEDYSVAGNG